MHLRHVRGDERRPREQPVAKGRKRRGGQETGVAPRREQGSVDHRRDASVRARSRATASTFARVPRAPTFTARTRWWRSTSTACRVTSLAGTAWTLFTPAVDCTVRMATAAHPNAPAAAKARRSATIPAPPPGSSPPMASAQGRAVRMRGEVTVAGEPPRVHRVRAPIRARAVPA